jgi:hypothetical protein
MTRARAIAAALATFLVLALPAGAATTPKDLWATVNVCDTSKYQDMMGVRASMPGDGRRTQMYMRFVAQYYDRSKQLWIDVNGSGISPWQHVGSGRFARRQGGYTFGFDAPKPGKTFVLRGAVDFKWVAKNKRIVRTAHVTTKGGHPNTKGADPEDYSAGLCELT